MKYEVFVNDPALPEGQEVEVPGLGVFQNKVARQIGKEEADYFRVVQSQLVDSQTDDSPPAWTGAAGTELRRGPTVLSAFKGHPTVSVEKVEDDPPVDESKPARAQKSKDSEKREQKESSKES